MILCNILIVFWLQVDHLWLITDVTGYLKESLKEHVILP